MATTREPGDLLVTVDPSRGRGAPGGRGEPSSERRCAAARNPARGRNEGPYPMTSHLHRLRGRTAIFVAGVLASALPATAVWAQDATPGPEDVVLPLRVDPHEVVVTASRVEQSAREVGQAVTVLTRDDIDRRQTVVVSDLLATTPGVTVTRNGGVGGLTGVSIRGAETAQTLVVIDGVRVNDPSSPGGGFDFANLLSSTIERVEVLRGPNSVPWGSQAIGGVVNIITQRPAGFEARAQAEGGSYGTAFASAGVSGRSGRFSGALNGGYLRTTGVSAAANGTEADGYHQAGGSGRLSVDLADGIGIDLAAYYAHSRVQLDGFSNNPPFGLVDDPEYSTTQEVYGYAGFHANIGRFANRVAFTIADINRDNYDPTTGADPIFLGRGRSERYEYQGDFRPIDAVRVILGAERENTRYYDGFLRAKTGISSGYGELIIKPVAPLTLTGGVRYDRHDQFGGHFTFGGDGALALGGGTTLRASYGEGFKAPTLYQLDSFYGNLLLRPEQARNFDGGVEQALLGGAVRASATYFNRRTRDQIDFRTCGAAEKADRDSICFGRSFLYDNIARTTADGVELALALRPVAGFTVTSEYSFINSRNRSPGANFDKELNRRPRQTASLSADYRFGSGLQLGGTVLVVSDSFDNLANTVRLDGYELTSLRAEYPIGERVVIYGRVENLFNERYQTAAGYGTLGRAGYGGVRLRFR